MGRPAKMVDACTGHTGQASNRRKAEESLKGGSVLGAPEYLTQDQKDIYNFILECFDENKMLGKLDGFVLASGSICIDQMQKLDQQYNADPNIILETKYRMAKMEVSKEFFRYCNELCLSPQARAKLSISVVKQDNEKKSIMDLLNEDEE